MTTATFQIHTPDKALLDLKDRLKNTRWPDELHGSGWDYGTNLTWLKQLVDYWQEQYDWRKHETALNKFAQFKTEINDVGIHFIHEKGKGPYSFPIILTHGWPDSYLRFEKIIPMLTDPEAYGADPADSFDVVVPSLPGYGFSGKAKIAGDIFHINGLWADLMTKVLGYKRFAAHGGDWGSLITEHMARSHAHLLVGIHLTDVPFTHMFQKPDNLSGPEQQFLADSQKWQMTEGAYNMIQSTRPETLAAGLNDSPAGLAGWIIDIFQRMSDCNGDLETCFTKDELITNIMIYWLTETIPSSFSPYYDTVNAGALTWIGEKVKEWTGSTSVPAAFAMFPKDNSHPPREWAERFFNVQRWTEMTKGGHFAAMEQPELLARDIRDFFRPFREL
jgi:pimeloyl-ACP methyl ester carboxylesterase